MPIGIVSDDDFAKELNSYGTTRPGGQIERTTPKSGPIEDTPTRGRTTGDNNVPDSLRKIIGETAVLEGRQTALQIARDFGISDSSVSAYAKGATSTASYNNPASSILGHINKSRRRAIKSATKTLNTALEAITQEKLDYTDAKDLAGIARDMSVLIKNLEPKEEAPNDGKGGPQFVIFAPQFRDERTYEHITVQE